MKTEWDYTELADAYLERPAYAQLALEELFHIAGLQSGATVCDIGAGVAHLTLPLAAKNFTVHAVEPNDAMRQNGIERTRNLRNVCWYEGTGELTGRPSAAYDFVTFGSSFNVCDRPKALIETSRLLKSGKYFTCMWNHRDLADPVQAHIESIIQRFIPQYGYGARREDQSEVILHSGLFTDVQAVEGSVIHEQAVEKTVEAWRSHGTLHRQAGEAFSPIIQAIEAYVTGLGTPVIRIPYTTRAWIARKAS